MYKKKKNKEAKPIVANRTDKINYVQVSNLEISILDDLVGT